MQVQGVQADIPVTKPFSLQLLFSVLSSGINGWLSCVLALTRSPCFFASRGAIKNTHSSMQSWPYLIASSGNPTAQSFRTSENSPACLYFFFFPRTSQVLNFALCADFYINFLLNFISAKTVSYLVIS